MESAAELLAAKTLSINKLLAIAPPGTIDPTPHLYVHTIACSSSSSLSSSKSMMSILIVSICVRMYMLMQV